ncbi:MAG: dTDP-4-dehydrorhamnose 3,5-epimerase [Chloroflexi bacterium]|nr:dTDP-4-dehydrorhamnose 3,5-epimerase [Chloroflexota bacterium]
MPFTFAPHPDLPEVVLITPHVFADQRGWFMESFRRSDFERHGITADFVQDDHSRSDGRLILRGLHWQAAPAAQGKLVRCTLGEIFDAVVDVRPEASTFGRSATLVLSAAEPRMLWIPPGLAHGFLTLSKVVEVQYKHTHEYSSEHARRLRWDDPDLAIPWPLDGAMPRLSPADAAAPTLREAGLH